MPKFTNAYGAARGSRLNGPNFVNGAEKGNCLAVYIKAIVPRGPQPVGTTALIPEFGGLVGTTATALLLACTLARICASRSNPIEVTV